MTAVRLAEIASVAMGTAPPGSSYNETGEGLALIAGAGDFGAIYPEPKKWTSQPSRVSEPGDLLVCVRATIGDLNWADRKYCLGRGVAGVRVNSGLADSKYVAHFLDAHKQQLAKLGTGSTFPAIRRADLEDFPIYLPPLPEQKRIAAILDAADTLRAKRRESIEQLDSLVQATFLEMFGDPVTNPKGWAVRELAKLVDIDADMVDPTEMQYRALLHYGPDRITKNTGELLPAQTAAQDGLTSGKFLCKPGHVLYSKIRPYLNKAAIVTQECLCSADVYPVSPRQTMIVKEFLWVVLRSKSFLGYIESCAGRANIPKINRKEFMAYMCQCPPISLQTRFASIVESIEQQKARLKAHLAELDTLFVSLQSRAFNGELVA